MPIADDYSRMTFVYFLKKKSEAMLVFQDYLHMAEHQTGKLLKRLRTDGAGELTSTAFNDFCSDKGIIKQVTVPYSSQMSGVAENKHQVLQFQARTMLLQAQLNTHYWAEAVQTANYIINRLPSSSLQGQIPFTLWTGRKPSLKHIWVFGSPTFVYIPDDQRKKFDARGEKFILVGYMDEL